MSNLIYSDGHEFRVMSQRPMDLDIKVANRIAHREGFEVTPTRYVPYRVAVVYDEPFAMAIVEMVTGEQGCGFSKCSPLDEYDRDIGRAIAVRRAIEDALNCR